MECSIQLNSIYMYFTTKFEEQEYKITQKQMNVVRKPKKKP